MSGLAGSLSTRRNEWVLHNFERAESKTPATTAERFGRFPWRAKIT